MRTLRAVLIEMKHLLNLIREDHVNRLDMIIATILLIAGFGTLIIGLVWVMNL